MVGTKARSKYKKKRRGFSGVRRQDLPRNVSDESNNSVHQSPLKVNRSSQKIERNCPINKAKNETVLTRSKAFKMGLGLQDGDRTKVSKRYKKIHSNKLMNSSRLQKLSQTQLSVANVEIQKPFLNCGRMITADLV